MPVTAQGVNLATTKQGESVHVKQRADIYKAVLMVMEQMPSEFLSTQLYKLAGLKDTRWTRKLVCIVLEQDFKFLKIKQRWRKT